MWLLSYVQPTASSELYATYCQQWAMCSPLPAVSYMQPTASSELYAAYCQQWAICSLLPAVSYVQPTASSELCAAYCQQWAMCNLLPAVSYVQPTASSELCAAYCQQWAICSLLPAVSYMQPTASRHCQDRNGLEQESLVRSPFITSIIGHTATLPHCHATSRPAVDVWCWRVGVLERAVTMAIGDGMTTWLLNCEFETVWGWRDRSLREGAGGKGF